MCSWHMNVPVMPWSCPNRAPHVNILSRSYADQCKPCNPRSTFATIPVLVPNLDPFRLQEVVEALQLSTLKAAVDACESIANHRLLSVRTREESGARAVQMLDELRQLERRVKEEPFYTPVSPAELKSVGSAFGYTHGHWYRCPNGHIYVIGDCGLANQGGVCPECGAPIGGAGYQLAEANVSADSDVLA